MTNCFRMFLPAVLLVSCLAQAQRSDIEEAKPCSEGQRHQFDFWVGNWDLSWPAGPLGPAGFGRNNVQKMWGNCVVQENFSGDQSRPLRGMSLSSYIPQTGQWKQTWVDNQGGYLDFVGESKNGEMVLSRTATVNGKEILQRMVWKNIRPFEFDWSWEKSEDGGRTWQVLWPIHYTRHKQ